MKLKMIVNRPLLKSKTNKPDSTNNGLTTSVKTYLASLSNNFMHVGAPLALSKNDNVVSMACHFSRKRGLGIVLNNIQRLFGPSVKTFIIAYSTEFKIDYTNFTNPFPNATFIFIEDPINRYVCFGKHYIVGHFIIKHVPLYNWVIVVNDSVIYGDVSENLDKILADNVNQYRGIVGSGCPKTPYTLVYQSWWLNFKKEVYNFWLKNLDFSVEGRTATIQFNECRLGFRVIHNFKSDAEFTHNKYIFTHPKEYTDLMKTKTFNFIKLRHLDTYKEPYLSIIKAAMPKQLTHLF